jgi:hypothetical protein
MTDLATVATAAARVAQWLLLVLALLLAGPVLTLALGRVPLHGDWRTATHRPAGLAPDAASHREAVVQVYAARAFAWRGAFADHTWIAVKPTGAPRYTRYEVIGWYGGDGRSVVTIGQSRAADAEWFGAQPRLLRDLRGAAAEAVIARLPEAVASYDSATRYRVWPGPNSNSFVAHLARAIPALGVTLPSTAVGKDWLGGGRIVAPTPSGTGWQVSFDGILGVALARDEGLEVNLLGLVVGLDLRRPALKLPGIGRVPDW